VLLPGQTLSMSQPGWFRLCFTAADEPAVTDAIGRLGRYLNP
jgi:hypothetical protein